VGSREKGNENTDYGKSTPLKKWSNHRYLEKIRITKCYSSGKSAILT